MKIFYIDLNENVLKRLSDTQLKCIKRFGDAKLECLKNVSDTQLEYLKHLFYLQREVVDQKVIDDEVVGDFYDRYDEIQMAFQKIYAERKRVQ